MFKKKMAFNLKTRFFTLFAVFILVCPPSFASRLPENLWEYIKQQLPRAAQRFDSVVVLDNNTMYVPLYPAQKADVETISVEYTYPSGKSLSSKPEVVIFNNNFVLMKIFKDKNGNFTTTSNENLPDKVKLGVMPQDMLVPTGLKVPESLKIIMGDLLIPNKGDNLLITASDASVSSDDDGNDGDIVPIVQLKDTKTFIANNKNKFVLVYDKGGQEPLYEIKLSGLPAKIVASPVTKFALAMYFGSKQAEIIDLTNERVLTKIDFENIPSDADIDTTNQLVYVTSARANAIYIVDLNSASLSKTIKLDRAPDKISVSNADGALVFNDKSNENLYLMDLKSGAYSIKKFANVKNLSRILVNGGRIAAISRTLNKAYIYKLNGFEYDVPVELQDELDLAEKPTDALIYNNKIFILCSKDGIINVYDFENSKMLEPIALDTTGFYSKMTIIPNKSNAVVTGVNTNKIMIINLEDLKLEKKAASSIDVADIVILDNKKPNKPEIKEKSEEKQPLDEAI